VSAEQRLEGGIRGETVVAVATRAGFDVIDDTLGVLRDATENGDERG
jgi:hypothetical protein